MEKQLVNFGPWQGIFYQGVRTGDTVHLAGQVGIDEDGKLAGPDIVSQTRRAYENVRKVLAEFGATMDAVVDETLFVTSIDEVKENVEGILGARAEVFGAEVPQVSETLVQVAGLWEPEYKIEVRCVARLAAAAGQGER
jgi:2-iminobutanoate/2-iminopropanoate deaminase